MTRDVISDVMTPGSTICLDCGRTTQETNIVLTDRLIPIRTLGQEAF